MGADKVEVECINYQAELNCIEEPENLSRMKIQASDILRHTRISQSEYRNG